MIHEVRPHKLCIFIISLWCCGRATALQFANELRRCACFGCIQCVVSYDPDILSRGTNCSATLITKLRRRAAGSVVGNRCTISVVQNRRQINLLNYNPHPHPTHPHTTAIHPPITYTHRATAAEQQCREELSTLRPREAGLASALCAKTLENLDLRRQLAAAKQASDPSVVQVGRFVYSFLTAATLIHSLQLPSGPTLFGCAAFPGGVFG